MNLWNVYCPLCGFNKVMPFTPHCPECRNGWIHQEFVKKHVDPPKTMKVLSDEEQLKEAKKRNPPKPKPAPKPKPVPKPKPTPDRDEDLDDYYDIDMGDIFGY